MGSAVPAGAVVSHPMNRSEAARVRALNMKRVLDPAIREEDCNGVETDTRCAGVVAMGSIVADGFRSETQGVSCICSSCKGRESGQRWGVYLVVPLGRHCSAAR